MDSVQRFNEMLRVFTHYGFGSIVDSKINNNEKKSAENLRRAFEELGPTFIKIGQILSTRPDLLSPPYINELSKLQDDVPPEKFEDIEKVFFDEFNKTTDEVFLHFDKMPYASASIAQVHTAVLKDGNQVIVKIQRPGIDEKMHTDISILIKIFSLARSKFADALIDPREALKEILDSTEAELDFNNEASNIKKFREFNKNVACVYAPYVYDNLSSSKVITMEKINGFKITDMKRLKEGGYDLNDLGKKFALSFFKQIFKDGFFHADPHPGNILIKGGKICYIDFGMTGSFNSAFKEALNDAVFAIAKKDPDKLISVIMSIGIKKGYINRNKLYDDIDYLFESYLSTSLQNIKMSTLLQEVFDCAKRNNVFLPKDFTLLIRSLVIVEGVVAKISPEIKIMDVLIPYVKSATRFSFLKDIDSDEVLAESLSFIKNTQRLPGKIIELSNSILNGRAKFQLQVNNLSRSINIVNKAVNRLVFALIISSMIIGSSLILNTNIGPKIYNISIIGIAGYGIAAIMGFWLLISIIRSGKL